MSQILSFQYDLIIYMEYFTSQTAQHFGQFQNNDTHKNTPFHSLDFLQSMQ